MLSSLLFAIAVRSQSSAAQEASLQLSQASNLLARAGYPLTVKARITPSGTIKLKDALVRVGLSPASEEFFVETKSLTSGLQLSIEIPLGRDVPLSENVRGDQFGAAELDMRAVPHLGRTAELQMNIPLRKNSTAVALRRSIEQFAKEGAIYAKEKGGEFANAPLTDWSKYRFPDSLTIGRADEVSLMRLLAAWGFKEYDEAELSAYGSGTILRVGEISMTIRLGDHFAPKPEQALRLSAEVSAPKGEDPFTWAVGQGHVLTWARVLPSLTGPSEFQQAVDLSRGPSVGLVRNAILNFAATIRSIRSEEGGS